MDIISDIMRSVEHLQDAFRTNQSYHGKQCLWCSMKQSSENDIEFHPQLTVKYKHPTSADFKASRENVTKRALLISVDTSTIVQEFSEFLRNSFYYNDIRIIHKNHENNISSHLRWLVDHTKPGDYILLLFVGKKLVEPIHNITTQMIYNELFRKVPNGVHLTTILDCDQTEIELPIKYLYIEGAIMMFDDQCLESNGHIVSFSANSQSEDIGTLTTLIMKAVYDKNARISLDALLYDVSQTQRNINPRLSVSRNITISNYYFCLTNQ
jgi:hypothetical protein